MQARIEKIREKERQSHTEMYSRDKLYETDGWLKSPIKTVRDLMPLFQTYSTVRVLDLGCGVGRNSIYIAEELKKADCRIECVDLLEIAIEKLNQYAKEYGVSGAIKGIISPIEEYEIAEDSYDLILAVSALEHVETEEVFFQLLTKIEKGIRNRGVVCLVINSEVTEQNADTHELLDAQFEVNLPTEQIQSLLDEVFGTWNKIKNGVTRQEYDAPRERLTSHLTTNVVTLVAKKPSP